MFRTIRLATVALDDRSTGLRVLKNPGPQEVQNLPRHPEDRDRNRRTFKVIQDGSDIYVYDAYFGWHFKIADMLGVDHHSSSDLSINMGRYGPKANDVYPNEGQVWKNDGYDLVPFSRVSPTVKRAFSFLNFKGDFA